VKFAEPARCVVCFASLACGKLAVSLRYAVSRRTLSVVVALRVVAGGSGEVSLFARSVTYARSLIIPHATK
jgi:hypothetical protein